MATPIRVESAGGEYMETVVVLEWAIPLGAAVKSGDTIVTVETAKAATDIPAPTNGFLTATMAEPGCEVPLSAVLGLIGATQEDREFAESPKPNTKSEEKPPASYPANATPAPPSQTGRDMRILSSPAARHEAERLGMNLRNVTPSSPSGRIKLRDLPKSLQAAFSSPFVQLPPDDFSPLKVHRSGATTGMPVLLIHGFSADAASWSMVERDISRRHPVLRLELPNHGRSPRRRIGSFADLARQIAASFDALNLDAVHLVGHSLGGACAMALADIRPRRVNTLTLLAPGGLGPKINGDFVDGIARASTPDSLGPWMRAMVADPRSIGDDFVRAAMASRADPFLRSAQSQMARDLFPDATQGFDLRPAIDRIACPTRIIWGRADTILPWQQALSAPGRVGLHLLEGCGHVPQLEQTKEVMEILQTQFQLGAKP